MSTTDVHLAYDGEAVKSGSMDVRELAPALLAVGDLFQRGNFVLNGDRASVSVLVRSEFQAGSFEVKLQVVTTILEKARALLAGDEIKAAEQLVKLLGLGKTAGMSLLKLMKRLRGKKPQEVTTLANGDFRLVIENHVHLAVPKPVYELYSDDGVRAAARSVVRPLRRPGIKELRVIDHDETVESVTTADAVAFEEPPETELVEEGNVLSDSVRESVLELDRASFEERLEWTLSDGQNMFSVPVRDTGFLQRVQRRELLFGAGDLLRVKLRTRTTRRPNGRIRTDYEAIEVLEVIPAQRQLPLLPPEG